MKEGLHVSTVVLVKLEELSVEYVSSFGFFLTSLEAPFLIGGDAGSSESASVPLMVVESLR